MSNMLRLMLAAGIIIIGISTARVSSAACCRRACTGGVTNMHGCWPDVNCAAIQCPPGTLLTSVAVDPNAICGEGDYSSCPTTEFGQCTDTVNNDAWLDALVDAADPDCQVIGAPVAAPSMGHLGLAGAVILLLGLGGFAIRRHA